MFDEWRKRRELRKRIASLKEQEAISRAKTDNNSPEYNFEYGYVIGCLQRQLAELETDQLFRKVRRMGIEMPQKESWWWEDETFEGEVLPDGRYEGKFYLTEFGKTGVSKLIKDERKKSIEWWITVIVVPLLSTLIGVLGLLVALFAIYSK